MTRPATHPQQWIRHFHSAPLQAPRLVCLPHAGGSASNYFSLSARMAPAVQVLAVQYPGRQDRRNDPGLGTVAELADAIFDALTEVPDLGEFALFGHSMGAVLAFEVAARFDQRAGIRPVRLFASGRRAPSRTRPGRTYSLDDDGLVAALNALNGTDSRLLADQEMRELLLPMIRNDYRAIETYRCGPGATVSCPITVFTGTADPQTSSEEAHDWRLHTTADCTVEEFPGGHFFINDRQQEIADQVIRLNHW